MSTINAVRGRTRYPGKIDERLLSPIVLAYTANQYDGIFNYLGTNGGKQSFQNPTITLYPASQSSTYSAGYEAYKATDHSITTGGGENHTQNYANSWWKVDFVGRSFLPNYIGIVGRTASGQHLRNWKVQGSNNDLDWTDLLIVTNAGPGNGTWFTQSILASSTYRYLKILQTGPNSNGQDYLCMGELEFWGYLY